MKNKTILLLVVVAMALLSMATLVLAAPVALSLPWWTVDGGGGESQGGNYVLNGTIGQPEAGHHMSGGNFNLVGGFWGDGAAVVSTGAAIYLPLVVR
jgi:hypothetical protein